jgi:hypothetical protein
MPERSPRQLLLTRARRHLARRDRALGGAGGNRPLRQQGAPRNRASDAIRCRPPVTRASKPDRPDNSIFSKAATTAMMGGGVDMHESQIPFAAIVGYTLPVLGRRLSIVAQRGPSPS